MVNMVLASPLRFAFASEVATRLQIMWLNVNLMRVLANLDTTEIVFFFLCSQPPFCFS